MDILKIARCTEPQVDDFIKTLSEFTLLITTDTNHLYTKIGNNKVLLNGANINPFSLDIPIEKDLAFYASNKDNIPLATGEFIGMRGLDSSDYTLYNPTAYNGEFLGVLNRYDDKMKKYVVDLITNLYVDNGEVGDIVYVGKIGGTVYTTVKPEELNTIYGVCGVVTSKDTYNRGRYTYNGLMVQSTYFLQRQTNNEVAYFEGYLPFVFPTAQDFVIANFQFGGAGETVIQQLPAPSELKRGCIFYCTNTSKDPFNKVILQAPLGTQVGGSITYTVEAGETVQFVADKNEINWQFLISNKKQITMDEVKSEISKEGYIKELIVQDDSGTVNVNATTIQFRNPLTVGDNGDIAEINIDEDFANIDVNGNSGKKLNFTNSTISKSGDTINITVDIPKATNNITVENADGSETYSTHTIKFKDGFELTQKQNGDVEVSANEESSQLTLTNLDGTSFKTNNLNVFPPLKVANEVLEPNKIELTIDHSVLQSNIPPQYLAYLSEEERLVKREGICKGYLWFDRVVVGGSMYIQVDRDSKALGIQEADNLDPNITGGMPYLLAYRIALRGKANKDGYIKIELRDKYTDDIISDVNGDLLAIEKIYKTGAELGVIELVGIIKAKAIKEFKMYVEHNFEAEDVVIEDSTTNKSGILIQGLNKNFKTGLALLTYENDTMQNINFGHHYFGNNIFTLKPYLQEDIPLSEADAGQGETNTNGLHMYNSTKIIGGIENKTLIIKSKNLELCLFNTGNIFNSEKTRLLHNKEVDIDIVCSSKENAFKVKLAYWTGSEDEYTNKIITDIVNDREILETNWVLGNEELFISEVANGSFNGYTKTFEVPSQAKNFAIIIYPIDKENPCELKIQDFRISVPEAFESYMVYSPELIGEQHLVNNSEYAEFITNCPSKFQSYRFTINDTETKLPAGIKTKGKLDIINDKSWSVGTDTGAEGDLKSNVDFKGSLSATIRVFSGEGIPDGGTSTLKVYFAKKDTLGAFNKISESEVSLVLKSKDTTPKLLTTNIADVDVKAGDVFRLVAISDVKDGAFVQSSSLKDNLTSIVINGNILTPEQIDIRDKVELLDREIVISKEAIEQGWYIELDVGKDGYATLVPKKRDKK